MYEKGEYNEARKLGEDALRITEAFNSPDHVDVAFSMNNLAGVYKALALYRRSETLYRTTIQIYVNHYGAGHVEVAAAMNNLAVLYLKLGRLSRAQALFLRSSAIIGKKLSPKDPVYSRSLSNVAELYRAKGELDRAESLQKRAVAIRSKYLGPHNDTASSMQSLGLTYSDKNDLEKARQWQQRALDMRKKVLPAGHADLGSSYHYLAKLERETAHYKAAEADALEALSIRRNSLGENHPDVAETLTELSEIYKAWQKPEKAQKAEEEWKMLAKSSPNVIFVREELKKKVISGSSVSSQGPSKEKANFIGQVDANSDIIKQKNGAAASLNTLEGNFTQGSGSLGVSGESKMGNGTNQDQVIARIENLSEIKSAASKAKKASWLDHFTSLLPRDNAGVQVSVSGSPGGGHSPMKPEDSLSDLEKRAAELEKAGRTDEAEVIKQLIRKTKRLQAQN